MKLETYFATLGSLEEQRRLDIISNNIANSNTPGYKKDSLSFDDVLGEVSYTSMAQGPIRETGNNLDIALSGNGFLSVKTDQGTLYTRAGNLTVNSSRQLVTQDGWPVLGKNDAPIAIDNTADLRITEDGQVFDGKNPVGQLKLVKFPPNSLEKAGSGYFEPVIQGTQPEKATDCIVHQGALEGPNFNPVEEMAKLIQTMRDFETYQKTMKNSDNLDSQLISQTAG